jgi:hypothetical protein
MGGNPRGSWEIALGLFGAVGVGLALAVPEAGWLGVLICLLTAAASLFLYRYQFVKMPLWAFRRRQQFPRDLFRLPGDMVLAAAVVIIGITVPIYVVIKEVSSPPANYARLQLSDMKILPIGRMVICI